MPDSPRLTLARLSPPAQQSRLLRRPRVERLLAEALEHPLTLLLGPAGTGKTTALAALSAHGGWPIAWLRARADDDPTRLLTHLAAAFRPVLAIDEAPIASALARPDADPAEALAMLVNQLAAGLDDETLLVIDDYHTIDDQPTLRPLIEGLLATQPLRLHIALASRVEPGLGALITARLRGELFQLEPADLAFTVHEAREFALLGGTPPPPDLDELIAQSFGWPLAIQIGLSSPDWRAALGLSPSSEMVALDSYLTSEVLAPLPAPLYAFVLQTAGLRRLDPAICAQLLEGAVVEPLLGELRRRRLFLTGAQQSVAPADRHRLPADAYRPAPIGAPLAAPAHDPDRPPPLTYQPILRAFFERQIRQGRIDWHDLHRRAARIYSAQGDREEALHHLLAADDPLAVLVLSELAPDLIAAGQAERALRWLSRLPQADRERPLIQEILAMVWRQLGRYEDALEALHRAQAAYAAAGDRAGQVHALRGEAEVYLDTVQPALATEPLKRALKLLPRDQVSARVELLRLQAENWANRGRADVALILERAASRMASAGQPPRRSASPPLPTLPPRLLLRAGRLDEARQQLEAQLWVESQTGVAAPHRASPHREPMLLLALIAALLGNPTRALALARRSQLEALQAGATLMEAIAELRLGHAYQIIAPRDQSPALQHYNRGITLIRQVGVSRTLVEGHMGLALLYGHSGELARAEIDAREGLQIATAAGDEWSAALILVALGGAAVAAGDPRAAGWLAQAQQRFSRGNDTYGQMLVTLWEALSALRTPHSGAAEPLIARLMEVVAAHHYEEVLIAPSMFGPRDMAMLVPLLLRGRAIPAFATMAQQLLRHGFPTIAADDTVDDYHPGYTLRIQMLGTFRVWRGAQEIQAREWQREKARQLFQLLLTYRGHWVQREQICAWLWPEADLEAAERQFKVTLNALNTALEPARPPRVAPFFIRRQGLAYSFAPSYGVWIDVDEFELRVATAGAQGEPELAQRNAQAAIQLYKGDYLAEALYDTWTGEERERLLARYLSTAMSYAAQLSAAGDQSQAVQICEQVLRRDRCYEEAYQVLMRAHARAGSRSLAIRSYTRCAQALRDELNIEPLPETVALYERIKNNELIE